jgi:hypothetical protein
VRQVNYGKVLSKRYFCHTAAVSVLGSTGKHTFTEINEQDVLPEHFQKLNTFKKSVASQSDRPAHDTAPHQTLDLLGLTIGAGALTHASAHRLFVVQPMVVASFVCCSAFSCAPAVQLSVVCR